MNLRELKIKVDQAIKDYGRSIPVEIQGISIEDCFIELHYAEEDKEKLPENGKLVMNFYLGNTTTENQLNG